MDRIFTGDRNALNMLVSWQENGIDIILSKKWNKNSILPACIAKALCWSGEVTTGYSQKELTNIECLNFFTGSHSHDYIDEEESAYQVI